MDTEKHRLWQALQRHQAEVTAVPMRRFFADDATRAERLSANFDGLLFDYSKYRDTRIRDVVNLGIGGSDLGPRLVCEALASYADPSLRLHFVSNVDNVQLHQTLALLDPATTLFIVASKTFTTPETLSNARLAR